MSCEHSVDFEELVDEVGQARCGQESLALWGGTCAESALTDFLAGWSLDRMPYRIWESTDRIALGENSLPPNVALLERGRLFGAGGDLELRRDGATFHWHFVGAPEICPPQGYDTDDANFWAQHSDAAFHCTEETVLLWGERQGDHWQDDRVAAAELRYPLQTEGRVQVRYAAYTRAGRVEFIWLKELEAYNG